MKQMEVPCIPGLGKMTDEEVIVALEECGAKFAVDHVCWPGEYPYKPLCAGTIAHTGDSIAILFHVRGLDLRSVNLSDNGRQWEDSTCEFFVADPHDGTYYNFETNCVATTLGAKGVGRNNRLVRADSDIASIRRWSSLPRVAREENGQVAEWTIFEIIPFRLIGIPEGELPVKLLGNFYKCADLTAHPHYLSWSPVGCPNPDFHRPEYFGELILGRV